MRHVISSARSSALLASRALRPHSDCSSAAVVDSSQRPNFYRYGNIPDLGQLVTLWCLHAKDCSSLLLYRYSRVVYIPYSYSTLKDRVIGYTRLGLITKLALNSSYISPAELECRFAFHFVTFCVSDGSPDSLKLRRGGLVYFYYFFVSRPPSPLLLPQHLQVGTFAQGSETLQHSQH